MNSHLRPTDSIASMRAPGSATASGNVGKPAPAPTSAMAWAARSSGTSSPVSESATCARQAALGSRTDVSERGSSASRSRTASSRARASPSSSTGTAGWLLVREERRDDHAAVGLVALAEGLQAGPVLEVVVDHLALGRRHRLELDLAAGLQRPLGGALGLAHHLLAAPVAVAGG